MSELIKIMKNIALVSVVVLALSGIGYSINQIIGVGWDQLTLFFGLLRELIAIIDFTWNTQVLLLLLGIQLSIEVIIMIYDATIWITKYFKH